MVAQGACFRENCRYGHNNADGLPSNLVRPPDRAAAPVACGGRRLACRLPPVCSRLRRLPVAPRPQSSQPLCRDYQNGRCFRARCGAPDAPAGPCGAAGC